MTAQFLETPTLSDLPFGSGFALWGFRACAIGHQECCVLVKGYHERFGARGAEALSHLLLLTRIIGTDGRRRVSVAMPGSLKLTTDELSLIALLAAAQNGEDDSVDAHFSWLLAAPPQETARKIAFSLGDMFMAAGLLIPAPGLDVSAPVRPLPEGGLKLMEGGHA